MNYSLITIALFCALSFFGFSQKGESFDVKWSDPLRISTAMSYLGSEDGTINTIRRIWGKGELYQFDSNLGLKAQNDIEKTGKGMKVVDRVEMNGAIWQLCAEADKKTGVSTLYVSRFDPTSATLDVPGKKLMELPFNMKPPRLSVDVSDNGEFLLITASPRWKMVGENKGFTDPYRFFVFDADLNLEWSREQDMDEHPGRALMNTIIGDNGRVYSEVTNVSTEDQQVVYTAEKLKVYGKDGVEYIELDFVDYYVTSFQKQVNAQGEVALAGLYSTIKDGGATGAFFAKFDSDNALVVSHQKEFEKDFITQYWSDWSKKSADKAEAKGKGKADLFSYTIRELEQTDEDGSFLMTAEQHFRSVTVTVDANGNRSRKTAYHYKDVVLVHFNADGSIHWVSKLHKKQSQYDTPQYLGYGGMVVDGKFFMVFLDNLKNYNEAGEFVEGDKIKPSPQVMKNSCIAFAEVNLYDGLIERGVLTSSDELDLKLVPARSAKGADDFLILFAQGRKEQAIGKVTFH